MVFGRKVLKQLWGMTGKADVVRRLLSRVKGNHFVMCHFLPQPSSAQVQEPRMQLVWSQPCLGISKADVARGWRREEDAEGVSNSVAEGIREGSQARRVAIGRDGGLLRARYVYSAPEKWVVQREVCSECKTHPRIWGLRAYKECKMSHWWEQCYRHMTTGSWRPVRLKSTRWPVLTAGTGWVNRRPGSATLEPRHSAAHLLGPNSAKADTRRCVFLLPYVIAMIARRKERKRKHAVSRKGRLWDRRAAGEEERRGTAVNERKML